MKRLARNSDSRLTVLVLAGGLIHSAVVAEELCPARPGDADLEPPEAVQGVAWAAALYGVASTGTHFHCVGQDGAIWTSVDGRKWQARHSPAKVNLRSVSAGNDAVVAVGDHGVIVVSGDGGADWENVASGVEADLSDVAFGDGLFVAVGGSGVILTSIDGQNWEKQECKSRNSLRSISYGSGQWLISGCARTLLRSEDGKNWTSPALDASLPCFGKTAFLADSFAIIAGRSTVLRSFDARSWQPDARVEPARLTAIAAGDGAEVAVGESGEILVSRRRGHWEACPSPTRCDLYGVGFGPQGFVAVGARGAILFSKDGLSWERAGSNP